MKLSVTIPNNHKVTTLRQPWQEEVGGERIGEVAALADRLGFSRLTVGEHFLMSGGHVAASGAHYVDAPTALAYLAGHTTRIRLASNVAIPALQHPVAAAKAVGRPRLAERRPRRPDGRRGLAEGRVRGPRGVLPHPGPSAGRVRAGHAADLWGAGWSPYLLPPERIAAGIEQIRAHPGYRGQPVEVFYNLAGRGGHAPGRLTRRNRAIHAIRATDSNYREETMGSIYCSARLDMPAEVATGFVLGFAAAEVHVFSQCLAERLEGDDRIVTLADREVVETNVTVDPARRRVVYTVPTLPEVVHHQAEMRVDVDADDAVTLNWTIDFLPHRLATERAADYDRLFDQLIAAANRYAAGRGQRSEPAGGR